MTKDQHAFPSAGSMGVCDAVVCGLRAFPYTSFDAVVCGICAFPYISFAMGLR